MRCHTRPGLRNVIEALGVIGAVCTPLLAGENLCVNGSFTRGLSGWAITGDSSLVTADGERGAVRLAPRGANVGIQLAEPLEVGFEIHRDGTYAVEARLNCDGIQKGDFSAFVFLSDSSGKFLRMYVYKRLRAGEPAAGWGKHALTFGKGSEHPFPEGSAWVNVRFSFHSPKGDCRGAVWVDDVSLREVNREHPSMPESHRPPAAAVRMEGPDSSRFAPLLGLLREAGFTVQPLASTALCDKAVLDRTRFDVLVLPSAEPFPVEAVQGLKAFFQGGGHLLSFGGPAFKTFCRSEPARAQAVQARPKMIADFEDGTCKGCTLSSDREGKDTLRVVSPGAAGTRHCLKVTTPDLRGWEYVGFVDLQKRVRPGLDTVHFWAKGADGTKKLCLELKGTDDSRWKMFVHLSSEWQEYSVPVAEFLPYASKEREPSDRLRPGDMSKLFVGYFRALVSGRAHAFYLDQVELRPTVAAGMEQLPLSWQSFRDEFGLLGKDIRLAQARLPLAAFHRTSKLAGLSVVEPAPGLRFRGGAFQWTGAFEGWTATGLEDDRLLRPDVDPLRRRYAARLLPLLVGRDRPQSSASPVASLLLHNRGSLAGSVWAFFGISSVDVYASEHEGLEKWLGELARLFASGCLLHRVEPRFVACADGVEMVLKQKVSNLGRSRRALRVRAELSPLNGAPWKEIVAERAASVSPLSAQGVGVRILLPRGFSYAGYRQTVSLLDGDRIIDQTTDRVDALATLRTVADWLLSLQGQAAPGVFSCGYCLDAFSVRALFALTDICGDAKYANAAQAWCDAIVSQQDDDGSWWMGYAGKDERWIADAGTIAQTVGIAHGYVDPARQARYLQALDGYLKWRETYRITPAVLANLEREYGKGARGCELHGIGVGLIRGDIFAKPRKALPKPMRERRGHRWTVGCSFGAAGMMDAIRGAAQDACVTGQDTRQLIAWRYAGEAYTSDAMAWVHLTSNDAELKQAVAEALRDQFIGKLSARNQWWAEGEGRQIMSFAALSYCYRHIEPEPRVLAEMMTATWRTCAERSLTRLDADFLASINPKVGGTSKYRYSGFALPGIAEQVQPGVTYSRFMPRR